MNSTIPADLLELKNRFEIWRANRKYLRELTTGQKFDNFPPDSNIEALEVGH
jgi:hypothetical protein